MGHEDGNMALDVYSGGLAIEPLKQSINKLTYTSELESLIRNIDCDVKQITNNSKKKLMI